MDTNLISHIEQFQNIFFECFKVDLINSKTTLKNVIFGKKHKVKKYQLHHLSRAFDIEFDNKTNEYKCHIFENEKFKLLNLLDLCDDVTLQLICAKKFY